MITRRVSIATHHFSRSRRRHAISTHSRSVPIKLSAPYLPLRSCGLANSSLRDTPAQLQPFQSTIRPTVAIRRSNNRSCIPYHPSPSSPALDLLEQAVLPFSTPSLPPSLYPPIPTTLPTSILSSSGRPEPAKLIVEKVETDIAVVVSSCDRGELCETPARILLAK